jgi:hypothetical protein
MSRNCSLSFIDHQPGIGKPFVRPRLSPKKGKDRDVILAHAGMMEQAALAGGSIEKEE